MSDLFNIYEDNFNVAIDRLKKIIETFSNLSKDKTEYAIGDANITIKEAEKLLKSLDIESSANTGTNKAHQTMKVRNYTNEIECLKKQFYKIQENYITRKSREALILGSEDEKHGDTGGQQKHKLIENEEMAWSQASKLEHAKRSALEIEKVSLDVMHDLHGQSDQMKGISVKISDMNEEIGKSDNLLSKMLKMENRNKVVLYGIGLILTIIIAFVLIVKFL